MANNEIVDGIATRDGQNIFANVSELQELAGVFAGFSSMCWEKPGEAGVFQAEELAAGTNAFVARATEILWSKIYLHMLKVLQEKNPDATQEELEGTIRALVTGMDLWN